MTSRRLILMRHAKSSWAVEGMLDHERPLNKRGKRAAPIIAEEITTLGWQPDFVVTSTARRTQETWQLMQSTLGKDLSVRRSRTLYLGGLGDIQEDAGDWPPEAKTVLCLGHNPGWERAIAQLSGTHYPMTTANAGLLEGQGETWADALCSPWVLTAFLRPPKS